MIGCIGVAPDKEDVPTTLPGNHGGNMDNKMIKTQIDDSILEITLNDEYEMLDLSTDKKIISNYRNHNIN